jgi:hypothetical protein
MHTYAKHLLPPLLFLPPQCHVSFQSTTATSQSNTACFQFPRPYYTKAL